MQKTAKKQVNSKFIRGILLAVLVITLITCKEEPEIPEIPKLVVTTQDSTRYQNIGTGSLSLLVNGSSMNLAVNAQGNITMTFPMEARDFASKTKTLSIPSANVRTIYENLPLEFTFNAPASGDYGFDEMKDADRDAIMVFIETAIKNAVEFIKETLHDGVVQPNLTVKTGNPESITIGTVLSNLSNPEEYTTMTGYEDRTVISGIPVSNTSITSLTVAGVSMNLAIDNSGNMIVDFPLAARNFADKTKVLSIPQGNIEVIYDNRTAGVNLTFTPTADSTYMTVADKNAVVAYLQGEIIKAVRDYKDTMYSDGHKVEDTVGTLSTQTIKINADRGSMEDPGNIYPIPPVIQNGTVWGNTTVLTIPGVVSSPITLDVSVNNNGSNAGPFTDIATLVNTIPAGSTRPVVVTFSKGTTDSVRFNVITALKTALAGRTSGAISMKSTEVAGQEVAPLFNGDDLFYAHNNIGSDRVFARYANNDVIFEGFTVHNSGSNKGWHIKNSGNKPIYIERLKAVGAGTADGGTADFLKGFGLESGAGNNTYVVNPVITGRRTSTETNYTDIFTPESLDAAFALLGLNYSTGSGQPLFTIEGFMIANNYDLNSTPKNLATSGLKTLAFLEKYMGSQADLSKLAGLSFSNNLNITGATNPFSGNAVAPGAFSLNGNVAAYLMTKRVDIKGANIGRPTLYTSSFSPAMSTVIENCNFTGAEWSNANFEGARLNGLIMSENGFANAGSASTSGINNKLWYVITRTTGTIPEHRVYSDIIEITSSAINLKRPASNTHILSALIAPTTAIANTLSTAEFSVQKRYVDGARPNMTYQNYAAHVAAGTTTINIDSNTAPGTPWY